MQESYCLLWLNNYYLCPVVTILQLDMQQTSALFVLFELALIRWSSSTLFDTVFGYLWPLQQMTNKMNAAKVLLVIIT